MGVLTDRFRVRVYAPDRAVWWTCPDCGERIPVPRVMIGGERCAHGACSWYVLSVFEFPLCVERTVPWRY